MFYEKQKTFFTRVDELDDNGTNHDSIKKTLQTNLDEVKSWVCAPRGVGNLDGLSKIWKEKFKELKITK